MELGMSIKGGNNGPRNPLPAVRPNGAPAEVPKAPAAAESAGREQPAQTAQENPHASPSAEPGAAARPDAREARSSSRTSPGPARGDALAETAEIAVVARSVEEDGFDSSGDGVARRGLGSASARHVEDLVLDAQSRPSLLKNMRNILLRTRSRLLAEYDSLRRRAEALVSVLGGEGGFSAAELERIRPELRELRHELARRRRRLAAIHRRLRIISSAAGGVPEARLGRRIGAKLEAAAKMPAGPAKDLALLEIGSEVKGRGKDTDAAGMLRIEVPDDADRHLLGTLLAELAPGAVITRHALAMLEGDTPARAPLDASLEDMRGNLPTRSSDWDTVRHLGVFYDLGQG